MGVKIYQGGGGGTFIGGPLFIVRLMAALLHTNPGYPQSLRRCCEPHCTDEDTGPRG